MEISVLTDQFNAIAILSMLLLGFGFLMVFVKKHGFSATSGTYLVVATTLPIYLFLRSTGIISNGSLPGNTIESLLFAEFCAAAALISMGAILGRVRVYQYIFLGILIVPAYMFNEWMINGGLGITKGFVDAAGSIQIHAFGAYFGIGLTLALTNIKHRDIQVVTDTTTDKFSMLGSMVLWMFWPCFCSAVVAPENVQNTIINTILALCGATLCTFLASSWFRKGKPTIADIANASLAGGVSIGATCDRVSPEAAFCIGLASGLLCVVGYVFIQPKLQAKLKIVDTCGVHNLHGMPGLLGGLVVLIVVPGAAVAQLCGIVFTVVFALATGLIAGYIIKLTGQKKEPYDDIEEFTE